MAYDLEKEKREAIAAGHRALNSLRAAQSDLNSAKSWGLWDMFGGGFFSTMIKRSKMDAAKQNMDQAKYELQNFSHIQQLNINIILAGGFIHPQIQRINGKGYLIQLFADKCKVLDLVIRYLSIPGNLDKAAG